MATKQEILNFVKFNGPVIPNDIKKQFGGDTYVISAYLSELSKEGLVKVSNTKIGGSPTYYAAGQESKLMELKKYLNEKDRRTVDLLREKKVLRDREQEMLIRVSLRNIKDFAKPIKVNIKGEKEVFWRWYQTPITEAEPLIRKNVSDDSPVREAPKQPEVQDIKTDGETAKKEEPKQPVQDFKEEKPKQTEGFLKQLRDYFEKKNIKVLEEEVIRKNSEIEFQIQIPSAVGNMDYFCKAKNKKKCNDGDLSSAYIKGQSLKLPVIFITTGEVTKKAREMLGKEFKGMIIKQI